MSRRFHLEKQTRLYSGSGYQGYSCSLIDELGPLETNDLAQAQSWVSQLQSVNPVGWNIWDSSTGECIEGLDIFGD